MIRTSTLWAVIALLGTSIFALADDWPHPRGPGRTDIVAEPSHWDGENWPTEEIWRTQVGVGGTSPLVVDGRLYTVGWAADQDTLHCFDAATGEELWKQAYAAPQHGRYGTWEQMFYAGMSATPEYDPETSYLYTLSLDGDLNCWNTKAEGANVWRLNFYDEYDVPVRPRLGRNQQRDYGYSSTPLVHHDWVIAEVGSPDEGTLMAFDKRTGERVWTSEVKDQAGHTGGPVPITVEGVPCAAVLTLKGLLVVRLDEDRAGETVATFPWITNYNQNTTTASVHGNSVLLTSEYDINQIARIDVTLDGAKEVWRQEGSSKVCVPVVHEGYVYWAWRQMFCLDFETGEVQWREGTFSDAGSCIVTADDRIIVWSNKGTLSLVETAQRSPDHMTVLATKSVLSQIDVWPHIVLADSRLYCKDRNGQLVCLQLGGAE